MSRNRHHRQRDHFGYDLDTAVILDGNVGDIPDGTVLHDALSLIASGGGESEFEINWANPDLGTLVYYVDFVAGELLAGGTVTSGSTGSVGAGGPLTPLNPTNANDGTNAESNRNSVIATGGSATYWWAGDLGAAGLVESMEIDGIDTGSVKWRHTGDGNVIDVDIEFSDDGSSWTSTPYSVSGPDANDDYVYTLTTPSTHRYWRFLKAITTGVFAENDNIREWYINGYEAPVWTLGPNIQDEDNATYHEVITGADVMRVALEDPLLVYEAIIRMAFPTTAERTYSFYGTNESDYSDLVLLADLTFAPIGSNTAENFTFAWTAAEPYQYYFLDGPSESRRIHELTLHAIIGSITTSHPLLINRDLTAQHPAESVSFDDDIAGLGEDNVQHAIEKLAAHTSSGTGISAVITNTTPGVKFDWEMPFAGSISEVRLLADTSGSMVVDLWKDTYANFPPTVADTITASAKPTLASASKYQDTTLTGWTTTFKVGDIIRVNVDSVSTITRATLALRLERSASSPAVGSIQLGLIDRTATIREPTLNGPWALELGRITQTAQMHSPTVT